jgi:hypothetical protein
LYYIRLYFTLILNFFEFLWNFLIYWLAKNNFCAIKNHIALSCHVISFIDFARECNIIQLFNGCGDNRPNYLSWGAGNDQVFLCIWVLYTCILIAYMGAIYIYIDCVYGCCIHVCRLCIWVLHMKSKIMSYEIMSIRTTFHRFAIWNVVLVYEKLSQSKLCSEDDVSSLDLFDVSLLPYKLIYIFYRYI